MNTFLEQVRILQKNKWDITYHEKAILQRYLGLIIKKPEAYKSIGKSLRITKQGTQQKISKILKKVGLGDTINKNYEKNISATSTGENNS